MGATEVLNILKENYPKQLSTEEISKVYGRTHSNTNRVLKQLVKDGDAEVEDVKVKHWHKPHYRWIK